MELSIGTTPDNETKQWFALRDLRPWNSKTPAYKILLDKGIEIFTPMHWVVRTSPNGQRSRLHTPVMQDLLFAHETRSALDIVIDTTDKLQYRYRRGAGQASVMTVPSEEMSTFIAAVGADPDPVYLKPSELTPEMIGREIIVNDGPLAGRRCRLLRLRGTRRRRLIVRLSDIIAATIEINPAFIQLP